MKGSNTSAVLRELLAEVGPGLCLDHRAVWRQLHARGVARRDRVLAQWVVREGIALELSGLSQLESIAEDRLVARLVTRAGVAPGLARWAVRAWAEAMDLPFDTRDQPAANELTAPRLPVGSATRFVAHRGAVGALWLGPDSLWTGGADGVVHVWTLTGAWRHSFVGGHRAPIVGLDVCGALGLSADSEGGVQLWDLTRGLRMQHLQTCTPARPLRFRGDGRALWAGDRGWRWPALSPLPSGPTPSWAEDWASAEGLLQADHPAGALRALVRGGEVALRDRDGEVCWKHQTDRSVTALGLGALLVLGSSEGEVLFWDL